MRTLRFLLLSIFATSAIWWTFRSRGRFQSSGTGTQDDNTVAPGAEPLIEIPKFEVWGLYDMADEISVSTVHVEMEIEEGFQPPMEQKLDLDFNFEVIGLTEGPPSDLEVQLSSIKFPRHHTPDASEIIFAMSTKLDRLRDSLPHLSQWASGINAHFVALVEPENPDIPTKTEIIDLYKQHDIRITLRESELDWWAAFTSLAGVAYDLAEPGKTKWVCLLDDDTYYFSMQRVLKMLEKYNSQLPYYVGGLSENRESWGRVGFFAYGGAGIFMSMPLLEALRPYVDHCVTLPDESGDIRLGTCIMNYTTTKLTWEPKLFQMDIHGDLSGFYEAPRERPLNTHHWNSWHHNNMAITGAISQICGNDCVLQKYITNDDWMITNGFSIVKYSYTEEEQGSHVTGAMEHTWDDTAWVIPDSWKYTLYPLKPKDTGKIQYMIEKVETTEMEMTQYFVRRLNGVGVSIIRLIWKKQAT